MHDADQNNKKISIWAIVKSVFSAMIGVQSDNNRQRDFKQPSMVPYLIVGVIFILFFVLTLLAIVSYIMPA